jgi:hypothetical protein
VGSVCTLGFVRTRSGADEGRANACLFIGARCVDVRGVDTDRADFAAWCDQQADGQYAAEAANASAIPITGLTLRVR